MDFSISTDNTPPVITASKDSLTFNSIKEVDLSKFNVKAYDKEDGDLTKDIMIINPPNITGKGTYKLKLTVKDSKGLQGYKTLTLIIKGGSDGSSNVSLNVNTEAYQRELRKEFYALINRHRANNGVAPLTQMNNMDELAYLKSEHMGKLKYFDHRYNDKKTQFYKDKWNANNGYGEKMYIWDIYPEKIGSYRAFGENIYMMSAMKQTPKELAKQAFTGWKNSPGHNRNMLNPSFSETGLGAYQADGYIYVTSNFKLEY